MHNGLILFLDYDGTLTLIATTPAKAVLPRQARKALIRLSKKSDCSIAIVSGRSLKDIKRMAGIKGIIYVGNHGLEIEGPGISFKVPVPEAIKKAIKKIKKDLTKALSSIKGLFIEDKGLTVSVHYRLVNRPDESVVKNLVYEIAGPYRDKKLIGIRHGKKVFEIRPRVNWDKGKAALWLLARERFLKGSPAIIPVYIGDDLTDEDAFRRLRKIGVTVLVGSPTTSCAEYYVNDPDEVSVFLNKLNKWQN